MSASASGRRPSCGGPSERLAEAQRLARLGSWEWDIANERGELVGRALPDLRARAGRDGAQLRGLPRARPPGRPRRGRRPQPQGLRRPPAVRGHQALPAARRHGLSDADPGRGDRGRATGNPLRMLGVCEDVTAGEGGRARRRPSSPRWSESSADAIVAHDARRARSRAGTRAPTSLYGYAARGDDRPALVAILIPRRAAAEDETEKLARVARRRARRALRDPADAQGRLADRRLADALARAATPTGALHAASRRSPATSPSASASRRSSSTSPTTTRSPGLYNRRRFEEELVERARLGPALRQPPARC